MAELFFFDFKLSEIISFEKAKQLYNLYQKVSMSILKITIFVFFDLLIKVCQNCHIDFKLGMMNTNTVWYNVQSAATR